MKRIRAVGIVIKDDEVLLIHRVKNNEYFTFPGGGVEEGETIEQAVIREIKEETTIDVKIKKLLYRHIYDNNTEHYFYLCEYVKGEPILPDDSPEKAEIIIDNEVFEPSWYKIADLTKMLLYPLEIRDLLLKDLITGFDNPVVVSEIKIAELRQLI